MSTRRISEERLLNTQRWADARIGSLSGAEVIAGAIEELLELRKEVEGLKHDLGRYAEIANFELNEVKRLRRELAEIGEYDCPGGVSPRLCPGCPACDANKALRSATVEKVGHSGDSIRKLIVDMTVAAEVASAKPHDEVSTLVRQWIERLRLLFCVTAETERMPVDVQKRLSDAEKIASDMATWARSVLLELRIDTPRGDWDVLDKLEDALPPLPGSI